MAEAISPNLLSSDDGNSTEAELRALVNDAACDYVHAMFDYDTARDQISYGRLLTKVKLLKAAVVILDAYLEDQENNGNIDPLPAD